MCAPQIPINARVKALEDAVPAHQQRLGAKGAGLGSPGKDLESRVSMLEDAMQSLLTAQARTTSTEEGQQYADAMQSLRTTRERTESTEDAMQSLLTAKARTEDIVEGQQYACLKRPSWGMLRCNDA